MKFLKNLMHKELPFSDKIEKVLLSYCDHLVAYYESIKDDPSFIARTTPEKRLEIEKSLAKMQKAADNIRRNQTGDNHGV